MSAPAIQEGVAAVDVIRQRVRQVLYEGAMEVMGDAFALTELFDTVDTMRQVDHEKKAREQVRALRQWMAMSNPVMLAYPTTDAHFPCLTVKVGAGSQDPSGFASGGGLYAKHYEVVGTAVDGDPRSTRMVEHRVIGAPETIAIEVGAWAVNPELSHTLIALARRVLVHNWGQLSDVGATSVTWSTVYNEYRTDPQMADHVWYVPTLTGNMSVNVRSTSRSGYQIHRVLYKGVVVAT